MPDGMVKSTRRVLPSKVVMDEACVLTDAPPPAGARVTVTFPGDIVPLGKPEPVTELELTAACPELGEAVAPKVIWVCASATTLNDSDPSNTMIRTKRPFGTQPSVGVPVRKHSPIKQSPDEAIGPTRTTRYET